MLKPHLGLKAFFAINVPNIAKKIAKIESPIKSAAKSDAWAAERVPFITTSLTALQAKERGFTSATGFSQSGKKPIGKRAVLVNMIGKVRRLTNPKKLSILFTDRAIPVKRVEKTAESKAMAAKKPNRLSMPKPWPIIIPLGTMIARTNVIAASIMPFARFWSTPPK